MNGQYIMFLDWALHFIKIVFPKLSVASLVPVKTQGFRNLCWESWVPLEMLLFEREAPGSAWEAQALGSISHHRQASGSVQSPQGFSTAWAMRCQTSGSTPVFLVSSKAEPSNGWGDCGVLGIEAQSSSFTLIAICDMPKTVTSLPMETNRYTTPAPLGYVKRGLVGK